VTIAKCERKIENLVVGVNPFIMENMSGRGAPQHHALHLKAL